MTDPLDSPPEDWGSDRYGYIELQFAPGVEPRDPPVSVLREYDPPCMDCNANLFLRFDGRHWAATTAHDDCCPTLARIEQERREY